MDVKVYANPFVALGRDGMPTGRLLAEPGNPRAYDVIGNKMKRVAVPHDDAEGTQEQKRMAKALDTRDVRVQSSVGITLSPVVMRVTPWLKERLGSDLVLADAKDAQEVGVKFTAPLDVLKASLAKVIAEWTAINGEAPAVASFELVQTGEQISLRERVALAPK